MDNLDALSLMASNTIPLIYIDPPFNTGKKRKHVRVAVTEQPDGSRVGFGGKHYNTEIVSTFSYNDVFSNFTKFIYPRLAEAHRILTDNGSIFVHLDYREVHRTKLLLDHIFGETNFKNEIIWAYDFGGRSKTKWPAKHDSILWYTKDPKNYIFNYDELPRIPYMAPGLVTKEKVARGKTPTDVWWHTIVPTNSKERTGYPTQKPQALLERIIRVHTSRSDYVLDFFGGSGTTGAAACVLGRKFILIDTNQAAITIAHKRLKQYNPVICGL